MPAAESIVGLAEQLARTHLWNNPSGVVHGGISGYDEAVPDLSPQARQAFP